MHFGASEDFDFRLGMLNWSRLCIYPKIYKERKKMPPVWDILQSQVF